MNCRGQDAFGRKKRQVDVDTDTSLAAYDSINMREEIVVTSNEIVTLEELPDQNPEAIEGRDLYIQISSECSFNCCIFFYSKLANFQLMTKFASQGPGL